MAFNPAAWMGKRIVGWLTAEQALASPPLCDFDRVRYEVRPCDVLLVEGRSRVSEIIRTITQSPWSHSALYIGRVHDIDDEELREKVLSFYTGDPNEQLICPACSEICPASPGLRVRPAPADGPGPLPVSVQLHSAPLAFQPV
jgi:hypothetical protein